MPSFNKILVANRGEIACRVLRTAHELGYRSVAVYSEADAEARHVQLADEAVCIGPAAVAQSYLNIEAILDAARRSGAEAIHPGYGFLSENAEFARACEAAGIVFIGPDAEAIHLMGSKRLSKIAMLAAGVPCIPGYEGAEQDDATLRREAERIGYPLMIKASAGGGGRGMRLVEEPDQLLDQLRTARSEALGAFGSAELILEKAVLRPRHVEIQVFGDRHGNLLYLGERDCSVQRRHQKVIEEAPCPVLDADLRRAMGEAAVKAAASVNYVGAGTVEFLLGEDGRFYFLEMNTRLQVEHPVTELVTGQDLVAWQIRVAEGHPLPLRQEQVELRGHAIEVRLYAEDAGRGFLPQTGTVLRWDPELLPGVRIDHGLVEGQAVKPFYDPMLAKLIAERFAEDPSLQPRQPGAEELALAAALLYQAGAEASAHQPGLAGWRSAAGAPWKIVLKHAEQRLEIGLDVLESGRRPRLLARLERREIAVRLLDCDGRWASAELDGIRRRHAYHLDGGRLWLYGHGGNLELLDVTHAGASAQVGASSGTLKAPMDGAIIEVLVGEGERVGKGQLLLVLEAMKMEHPLKAGVNGVVRRVQVGRGEQVRNRQVLVEVEADA
ncbi:geranyl-CoA carboxylase subunit apha [Pseudomonas aeruginosa]|uniref:geranyl-CoA carboxylase subunit apha n=1 Tax=Pseudomonas aeruginosa TaxID=287 RepID=UPI0010455FCF|nr:geranyl-CoA carboxylase subunit apha [Pseudomonas aeruginosa]